MTDIDWTTINLLIGTFAVPPFVGFLNRQTWEDAYKRWTAFLVCLAIAFVQLLTTGQDFTQVAKDLPILFGMATMGYVVFFKNKMGAIEELDPLGKILGPPK